MQLEVLANAGMVVLAAPLEEVASVVTTANANQRSGVVALAAKIVNVSPPGNPRNVAKENHANHLLLKDVASKTVKCAAENF